MWRRRQKRFDAKLMLPEVTKGILIEEALAGSQTKVGESDVRRVIPKPHTTAARHPIALTLDTELVEMGVGPPHGDLEGVVQIGDGTIIAHEQTPPDHRVDAQQDHFELVDGEVCGEGHGGILPGSPLISHTFFQSRILPARKGSSA